MEHQGGMGAWPMDGTCHIGCSNTCPDKPDSNQILLHQSGLGTPPEGIADCCIYCCSGVCYNNTAN